ncbi:hypothetical protein EAH89_20670 [Roseomonas nepalensis]|uniref:Carbohydrate binding module xylan-binding domain-containing protein n=1 Tax=Muricoccus nepalensis TaxID=1854500 RepID=A0A502FJF3_9PROT|nr:carbohydrate-binding domain-containing protein [Roseomonas nepalensis]TPG49585.1 hypothetical protein EAH89_20670 [Roseomonas nepalensis]
MSLESHLQVLANERLLGTLLKGVDIILGAGSNTRLGDADDLAVNFPGHAADFADTYPVVITAADGKPTLLVNTDNEYTYLGRLKVDFDANGEVILANLASDSAINGAYAATAGNVAAAWGTSLGDLDATAFAAGTKGSQVRDLTDAVQGVIVATDANVFGYTGVYLEGERSLVRSEETNLGSLSADANAFAFREALGLSADSFVVSFKNGGGIRAQIGTLSAPDPVDGSVDKLPPLANPAAGKQTGGVSLLDVENSLRFDNKLMAFDTTPEGLKAILEHGVAAGTLQGRFPQIGGVSFSWDPDLPAGSRVSDIGLLSADGRGLLALYNDGAVLPGAPARISVVTLNFLANGGDGYPAKENGENFRYLLSDGTLSGAVDEALNFTDPGVIAGATPSGSTLLGEQQAFGTYLAARYATPETAYALADTPVSLDERIQKLNFRADTVLAGISMPGTGITIGEGPDSLVLRISQDAWVGDAQYVVKVDGIQVGGVLTASALHASGQSDVVTVRGDWAGGLHGATIEFLNDAWGGTPQTDRNLYLDGATYNGVAVAGANAVLEKPGPAFVTFTDTGPVTVPAPASATIGAGADSLVLKISQDAYLGAAQYTVAVDGVQIDGVLAASATRASGGADTLTVLGNWSGGLHEITVQFLNDAWDGTPETDRNLYLEGATYNGVAVEGVVAALEKPVAASFTVLDMGPVGAPVTTTIGAGPDGLVLRVSQDAYRGDAAYTVSVDGVQIGGVLTASALRSTGSSDTLNVFGNWGEGVHEARIEFLNDAWGGTPETDRNLFLDGATYGGAVVNGATATLERPGAAVFTFEDAATSGSANNADLLFAS